MTSNPHSPPISVTEVVQNLKQVIGAKNDWNSTPSERISSGFTALDQLLPQHSFRRGSLVEWLDEQPGSGTEILSLLSARKALHEGGAFVVIDHSCMFYPPAAAAWGINLEHLVLVRPQNNDDKHWVWDQALRCPGVAVVWGWLGQLDGRWFRRFQLSAEASGCLGFMLRSENVRGRPSWSDLQLHVSPRLGGLDRQFRVELVRCRGQGSPQIVDLELNELTGELRKVKSRSHETNTLHLATQLAHPKTRRRSSRA